MRKFYLDNIYSYNYNYLPLWLIGFLINILRWSEIVITGILIFEITSSPFQVTLLLILRFLSLMSFSVFSGIIVDKYNKKYCLSISLFLIAIISILFYSFAKQNINIYILHLYSVLSGGFWAMESTARKALIIESIKEDFYAKYISLDTLSLHITRCIGPLLSGFFYNYITISYLFLFSFSTYIICFTLSIYIENNKNPSSTSIISIYDYKLIYKKIINEKYLKSLSKKVENIINITPRYLLVHSLAHSLISELAKSCGYNEASLRERLYISDKKDEKMSGILIYTSSSDSEGTLGGLSREADPNRFKNIFLNAIKSKQNCSQDPHCIMGIKSASEQFNHSACHACMLLPETSCQNWNRFLDRAMLRGDINDEFKSFIDFE